MIRQAMTRCAFSLVNSRASSAVLRCLEWGDTQENILRVLTYHRVDWPAENPDLYPGVHSATPEQFARQLDDLTENYRLVSLDEALAAAQGGPALPRRAVLLTFDDAYQGFDEHAWPVLNRHQAPVVLFVPTGYPDQPEQSFWWDRLHWAMTSSPQESVELDGVVAELSTPEQRRVAARKAMSLIKSKPHRQAMELVEQLCEQLQVTQFRHSVLSWRRLQELASAGVTLGAHTHTHPLLNQLSLADAQEEANRSRQELEQRINAPVRSFAYPAGGCTYDVARMLEQQGFTLAFTTQRGINDLRNADRLQLKRINVGQRSTQNVLRAQLLSYAKYLN